MIRLAGWRSLCQEMKLTIVTVRDLLSMYATTTYSLILIRSSPQWWSGRSVTAYIVLDLRYSFGALAKAVDCSKHKFRAGKCLIKRALLTFSSISNRMAAIWRGWGTFRPLDWGLKESLMQGLGIDKLIDSPPTGFDKLSLTYLCYLAGSSVRPAIWLRYDDNYHYRS